MNDARFGSPDRALKTSVRQHWEQEACGTRYGDAVERRLYFQQLSEARYALEPYIPPFADFASARQLEILEIGVGTGADFANWCRSARHATGIDLTDQAVELTRERLQLDGVDASRYSLKCADAEELPFTEGSFDLVYSWGVLHHTPDTPTAFREVFRILRPGGKLKAMVYHTPSWTGLILVALHGWLRGRFRLTQKQAMFERLESPGTKGYSVAEMRELLEKVGFSDIRLTTKLGPGDLLNLRLSERYRGTLYRMLMILYPRWLELLLGDRYGLNLMIEARKPRGEEKLV